MRRGNGGGIYYYAEDRPGTSRVMADSTGAKFYDADFPPFGQEVDYANSRAQNYKLGRKERDAESGLDYFGARYDSSTVGRFLTPDWAAAPEAVPYANLADPQSLNLYAYVMNNPVTDFDVDGHHCGATGPNGCPTPKPSQTKMASRQKHGRKSLIPRTLGVEASASVAETHGHITSTAHASVSVVGSLSAEEVGVLSSVGHSSTPASAPAGGPEALGEYAGAGLLVVISNGAPRQLLGKAKTYQLSIGATPFFSGTVKFSRYPGGIYKISFTPFPDLPASGAIGLLLKKDVGQVTRGLIF